MIGHFRSSYVYVDHLILIPTLEPWRWTSSNAKETQRSILRSQNKRDVCNGKQHFLTFFTKKITRSSPNIDVCVHVSTQCFTSPRNIIHIRHTHRDHHETKNYTKQLQEMNRSKFAPHRINFESKNNNTWTQYIREHRQSLDSLTSEHNTWALSQNLHQ